VRSRDLTTQARRPELDSLRGLAALSVLAYHALASNSETLTAGLHLIEAGGPVHRLLVFSPAHVLWLGAEAVWLFFVLSGFVLHRSTSGAGFDWFSYYPSRLVRLYLPVAAAVGLAWLTYLVPHVLTPEMDQLLPTSYPLQGVLTDLTLLGGTTTSMGVLWSLQWEIVFSLLLPVYVLLARQHRVVTGCVAAAACLLGWWVGSPALQYLPMFFLGSVMAEKWEAIRARFSFLARGGPASWATGLGLLVLACCGLTSFYLLGRPLTDHGLPARVWTLPLVLAAIALLIVLAQEWPPLRRALSTRPAVFLGTISFSLYLVHLPVVVLFLFVIGPGPLSMVTSVATALVLTVVFHRLVERPAHRLARRIRARVRKTAGDGGTREAAPAGPDPGPLEGDVAVRR
jgi:peptidoglycan/LPS O-acetylase OafA/YrhL